MAAYDAPSSICGETKRWQKMKYIEPDDIANLPGQKLTATDRFHFRCHPGLGCFNRCCRNLNLFLYPYDVIQLKRHLNITSDRFLDRYVDVVLRPGNYFPDVLLRMSDCSQRTCPFLSETGCRVYESRPYSCRLFPVEQGALYDADRGKAEMVHFFRPPSFCLGQHELRPWTADSWVKDQEAERYINMTTTWSELKRLFTESPWGPEGPNGSSAKMAFMTVYNIDRFREFVFGSSFLKRYKVKSSFQKKIRSDDVELLQFGFGWVKHYLWGIRTPCIKER